MASFINNYPNLPGMLVEFKDGGSALRFDAVESTTDSLLLLGTAVDGPVLEPVAVDSSTVELIFGSDTRNNGTANGSTLVHAFKQAYAAGCRDIRCMRITGEKATCLIDGPVISVSEANVLYYGDEATGQGAKLDALFYELEDDATAEVGQNIDIVPVIRFESIFGGSVYNEGKVKVEETLGTDGIRDGHIAITITKPQMKTKISEDPQVYSSADYPTFGDFVDAFNDSNTVYRAYTENPEFDLISLAPTGIDVQFTGGDDGVKVTKDELFEALSGTRDTNGFITKQGAYQLLENYLVDYVVPVGVYADDSVNGAYKNFAYELALFCAILTHRNRTTHGFIAMKPLVDTTLAGIGTYAKYLTSYKNNWYMHDYNGNTTSVDLGMYISVVAGPTPFIDHAVPSLRSANPAVVVAGYNSTLWPQTSTTNKVIHGTNGVKFNFSNSQANDIVGNRFVLLGTKYGKDGRALHGAYVIKGPTAARPGSEFGSLTTIKVLKAAIDNVREVADLYIGEANTVENRNALASAIDKRLGQLADNKILDDYSFTLVASAADQAMGQAKLELGIVAPGELNKITTIVGLK